MNLYEFGLVQKKYEEIKPKIENGNYNSFVMGKLEDIEYYLELRHEESVENRLDDGSQIYTLKQDMKMLLEFIETKENQRRIIFKIKNIEADFRQLKMRIKALEALAE